MCHKDWHTETPVGAVCPQCTKRISEGDQGLLIPFTPDVSHVDDGVHIEWGHSAWHLDCFLENVGVK